MSSTVVVLPQASVAVIVTLCGVPVGLKRERSMVNDARAVLPSSSKRANFPSISPRYEAMPLRLSLSMNEMTSLAVFFTRVTVGGVWSVVTA